jgi:uncharacterized phage infection (PIP) family protein YhgE
MTAAIAGTAVAAPPSLGIGDAVLRAMASPDEFKRVADELQGIATKAQAQADSIMAQANAALADAQGKQTVAVNTLNEARAEAAKIVADALAKADEVAVAVHDALTKLAAEHAEKKSGLEQEIQLLTAVRHAEKTAIDETRAEFDAYTKAHYEEMDAKAAEINASATALNAAISSCQEAAKAAAEKIVSAAEDFGAVTVSLRQG